MGTPAYWLSAQEKVEVEAVFENRQYGRCWNPRFQAKRADGSRAWIDRADIILDEEQALIDELSMILQSSKHPLQHERYAFIMRQFIMKGVPYVSCLKTRKPEQLDLFHAG